MLNHQAHLDHAFRALADPARRAIVERLSLGPASVSELAQPLAMSMPAVMQHIGVLETGGLVATQKAGRVRVCRLAPEGLSLIEQWLEQRRAEWNARLDRLGDYLATLNDKAELQGEDQ